MVKKLNLSIVFCLLIVSQLSLGYVANKVWFEFQQDGSYKVVVNYTVPEMKEYREAYVIFYNKKSAEKFYWSLVRGADFFPANPYQVDYVNQELKSDPW